MVVEMGRKLQAGLLIALLATPGFAQETNDAPAQEGAATEPDLTASAATQGEQTGETIEAVHKDWQIRCLPDPGGCYMYQLAIDSRDAPVAEMSVVKVAQGNDVVAGFTVMTPLKTFLPAGAQVQIDNGQVQRYQYEFCAEQGCIARFGVSDAGLNQFRSGNKVRITVVSAENRETPVILDVSLLGFTAAMADLATR